MDTDDKLMAADMKPVPSLQNDFIVNEREYQACKAWLAEADEETIRHPLEDPELEVRRRHIKGFVDEYEQNWRHGTCRESSTACPD